MTAPADRDRAIIEFERQWWKFPGAKDSAIHEQFGISATRYYQLLNALVDRPEAMAYDAMTVRRLQRLRDERRRARSSRRAEPTRSAAASPPRGLG